jgi:O-methyltransferase involved in polyketide biosynthesis
MDLADMEQRRKFLRETCAKAGKVLVLTEGVIPYLTNDAVGMLGQDLHAETKIQYWIADYFSPASYRYRRKSGITKTMKNAPFLFEPENYFALFESAGWKQKDIRYLAEEASQAGRPPPFPFVLRAVTWISRHLASPERRRKMGRYAGFVLFERTK